MVEPPAAAESSRVLILASTTSYRAGAFLAAADALGVPVVVGSDRRQALAHLHPSGHLTLDFQDPVRAAGEIAAFAQRHPIAAVVAADDDGAVLGAMAASALGLRHHPVGAVAASQNKLSMREILSRAGIPSPGYGRVAIDDDPASAARRQRYPCVVKPLFLSASRGVIRADDPQQFVAAFTRLRAILQQPEVAALGGERAHQILVEDYVPGVEVALEGLVQGGRLRVLAIFDKPEPLAGPYFEETLYVTPTRLGAEAREAIVALAARAVAALELVEGPVHAELRWNDHGAWIIEIAPRSIGGLCSRVLRFGPGVSLEELILRQALGWDVDAPERESVAAGVMMIPIPHAGVLRRVTGEEEARAVPGIEEIRITIPPGQTLVPLPEGARYLGFIFARGGAPERVEEALRQAHRRLQFEIDGDPAAAAAGEPAPGSTRGRRS